MMERALPARGMRFGDRGTGLCVTLSQREMRKNDVT